MIIKNMQKLPEAHDWKGGDACAKERNHPDKRKNLVLFQQWPAKCFLGLWSRARLRKGTNDRLEAKNPRFWLGHLRVGELHYWLLGTSLSHQAHIGLWVDEQRRPVGFEPRLLPDFPPPLIPALIELWVTDFASSPVWWEANR